MVSSNYNFFTVTQAWVGQYLSLRQTTKQNWSHKQCSDTFYADAISSVVRELRNCTSKVVLMPHPRRGVSNVEGTLPTLACNHEEECLMLGVRYLRWQAITKRSV